MNDRKLLRIVGGRVEVHADLRDFPGDFINDMVVDDQGRPCRHPERVAPAGLCRARRRGCTRHDRHGPTRGPGRVDADHTASPTDGTSTVDPDRRDLRPHRVVAYDRASDGSLSNRRVYAEVGDDYPDGLCLDDDGALWIGSPYTGTFIRVREGGEVTDRVPLPGAVACMLGGEDRRLLFLLGVDPAALRTPGEPSGGLIRDPVGPFTGGHIWTLAVEHPGAGWP